MKVKDVVTGNTLFNTNSIVVESWKANPARFIPIPEKPEDAPQKPATRKGATKAGG
jgi:hypothetical protein